MDEEDEKLTYLCSDETVSLSCNSNVSSLTSIIRRKNYGNWSNEKRSAKDNIHANKTKRMMKYIRNDIHHNYWDIIESQKFVGVYYFNPTIRRRFVENHVSVRNDGLQKFTWPIPNDHLCYRYQAGPKIGQGSYGLVIKAHDHKWNRPCAIKIFRYGLGSKTVAYHEFNMMKVLQTDDKIKRKHIVDMYDNFCFRDHYCIVFELLEGNLHELLAAKKYHLDNELIRSALKSILKGLSFMHERGLIHGDLKPSNIGYFTLQGKSKSYEFKLLDFGKTIPESKAYETKNIQTPIFRAPEVFLQAPYDTKIDIFSFGCTAGQLVKGDYIFNCDYEYDHESEVAIMYDYVKHLGFPPRRLLELSAKSKMFFKVTPNEISFHRDLFPNFNLKPVSLEENVKMFTDPSFIDLLKKSLDMNPSQRLSAEELLQHFWLQEPRSVTLIKPFCVLF